MLKSAQILGFALLSISVTSAFAVDKSLPIGDDEAPIGLDLDVPVSQSFDLDERNHLTFTVDVPSEAIVLVLEITEATADLDLWVRHAEPIEEWDGDEIDFWSHSEHFKESLRISRNGLRALETGTYYVDVGYQLEEEPELEGAENSRIEFTIKASLINHRVDGKLVAGVPISAETTRDAGWFRSYAIDVPAGVEELRIDLDALHADLDLALRREAPVTALDQADHVSDSPLARESLLVDENSDPPLSAGRWYLNVIDPVGVDRAPFTVWASFSQAPPENLAQIPRLDRRAAGIRRAVTATVELITPDAFGSGTLISRDGWILTNHHVVELASGDITGDGEVVIGLCLDARAPTTELFRGSVVAYDEDLDLALVRVTSGLYGQSLPADYSFPFVRLGNSDQVELGDSVSLLGYPGVGGLGSRSSLSLTRGVISGFDTSGSGLMLKTDAEMGAGASGGGALDETWRLIGVPGTVMEETDGLSQLGFILPISRMPLAWRDMIKD